MGNWNLTLTGIIVLIALFLGLTAFVASQIQVNLPYSTDTASLLSMLWHSFGSFLGGLF